MIAMQARGARWLLGLVLLLALSVLMPMAAAAQADSAETERQALELLDRGEMAASDGRFEEAESLWRQALALKPGWAVAQRRIKDLDRRRRVFLPNKESRQRRRQARLDFVQGVNHFNKNEFSQAAEYFERFLKVFPDDEAGRNYLELARGEAAAADLGTLWLDCRPEAQVYLDGNPAGMTPLEIHPVLSGDHKVSFTAYGVEKSFTLQVQPKAKTSFVCTLEGAELSVESDPRAEITLDDNPVGETPLIAKNLPVGPRRITAQLPGYESQTKIVILRGDLPKELYFRLKPLKP